MMKLKALRNIDGVVKAHAGQEFEVTNLQQAKDLIQQGVAYSTDAQGQEVKNLLSQDEKDLVWEAEVEAIRQSEFKKAEADSVQQEVNQLEDQKQEKIQKVKDEAKMQAQQKAQQSGGQAQQSQQSQAQAQKNIPKSHVNDQTF